VDLAKIVTGFAIAQGVVLGYKAAEQGFHLAMRSKPRHASALGSVYRGQMIAITGSLVLSLVALAGAYCAGKYGCP
jgi:hypothetical protein